MTPDNKDFDKYCVLQDHVCDKKSMSGHQTAHARQDKVSCGYP